MDRDTNRGIAARFGAIVDKLTTSWSLPGAQRAENIFASFSSGGKFVVYGLSAVLIGSLIWMLAEINHGALVEVPAHGGSLDEGIVGSPRFVNPLLAITDADRDLTELIYSGLMRPTPSGTFLPDLAERYDISDDGLTYTFHLRSDATFHDGTPVTADDVLFTIQKAQDATLKSPRRANWDGVTVTKEDEKTIVFTLKQPYSPFLENTAMGILPKHVWENVTDDQFPFSELNVNPIGSGPYAVTSVKRDSSGIPVSYALKAFKNYALGEPYISRMTLHFYQSSHDELAAYRSGDTESIGGISATDLTGLSLKKGRVESASFPRVFGLFFNQNEQPLFANAEVRKALDRALDKKQLVATVFSGYASPLSGPVPPGIIQSINTEGTAGDLEGAATLLANNGWKAGEDGVLAKTVKKKTERLAFSITTANVPELRATAQVMKDTWEKLGASVDVKIFEPGDLSQNVIRPRKYDSLLFGEIVGRELDLYAFWHSSQRNDPGLNVAMYVNSKADKLLENIRATSDAKKQAEYYQQFQATVSSDMPAVFAYSPDFMYIVPEKVKGVSLGVITTSSERFLGAYRWYIESDRVWSLFL